MNFDFTEEELAVQGLAKAIFKDMSTTDRLKEVEASEDGCDHALWGALAKAELLGCALPESVGGSDFGFQALCLLLEQAGRQVARIPLIETLVSGALPIARFGTEAQRQAILPEVATGKRYLSAALAEAAAPSVQASSSPEGFTLSGEARHVPAAHLADLVLVPARTAAGVAVFLLDPKAEGVSLTRNASTDYWPVVDLRLEGVALAEDAVLPGGEEALDFALDATRAAMANLALGVSYEALIMTAKYSVERHQFGRPIGSFQAVGQRAADAYIDLEAMRLSAWQAAWKVGAGLDATREVAIAKYWAAEGSHRVLAAAQHIHGGMGFDKDYPLHRYYLLAKRLELSLGGAGAQLAALGQSYL